MSERVTNVRNPDLLKDVANQNTYCGVTAWNEAGITGKGVVVWNMEKYTDHGMMTHDRVLDAAPDATVLNANVSQVSNNKEIEYADACYVENPKAEEVRYPIEEFIKTFGVKIITRSFGGTLADRGSDRPNDQMWCELKEKYNLILFDAADNDGDEGRDESKSLPIQVQAVSLSKGKPQREGYSSTLTAGDVFAAFVGWANGTSFACPYMAGMAALLVERYGDLTQEQVIEYFKAHAEDLEHAGFDKYTGYGLAMLGDPKEQFFKFEPKKEDDDMAKKTEFIDVPEGAWYEEAVAYCKEKGYMAGIDATRFGPNKPLTRAQMAQVLYNLDKTKGEM